MRVSSSHWRLGAFTLLVVGAVVGAVIALGECTTHRSTVPFVSYFDESVGGLTTGGRVVFRGVEVGTVSAIEIAPDHRHVQVSYGLDADALRKMGITILGGDHGGPYAVPPELRAQIGGNGLTGVRNVSIDLFDPQKHPAPIMTFAVASNCIPAATSTMKTLEDALTKTADRMPGIAETVARASERVEAMLDEVARGHLPDKAAVTLAHADAALRTLTATMRRFDDAGVPEKTTAALGDVSSALAKLSRVLDGVSGSTRDVDQALDELRDTAEAIRVLAEDLDRDPDMLLKGRATRGSR
ncbi:MAG TPA: MlaD family protein [Polyangiaceae bacterium]